MSSSGQLLPKKKSKSPSPELDEENIAQIGWSSVEVFENAELGKGSFGSVVLGLWKRRGKEPNMVVAIKLLFEKPDDERDYQQILDAANKEANNIRDVRRRLRDKSIINEEEDVLCKVYAVATGELTDKLSKSVKSWPKKDTPCVGILMRYEVGGSLKQYIKSSRGSPESLLERIRLSMSVCKGMSKTSLAWTS